MIMQVQVEKSYNNDNSFSKNYTINKFFHIKSKINHTKVIQFYFIACPFILIKKYLQKYYLILAKIMAEHKIYNVYSLYLI